jgi:hypothetical protein
MSVTIELSDGVMQIDPACLSIYNEGFYSNFKPSRKIFNKFVIFADHYASLDAKVKKIYDDLGTLRGAKLRAAQAAVKTWYDTLVSDVTSANEIIEFVNLADVCGNETMYTLACATLAEDLNRMASPDEIRIKYGFENDLTESDTAQLTQEDKIWQEIKD